MVELDYNTAINQNLMTEDTDNFIRNVMQLIQREKSTEQIVKILVEEHRGDNKGEFYPLVETLFRIIGVDCRKSRDGVNGERWDAMIRDAHKSIPIEIKSPGEEEKCFHKGDSTGAGKQNCFTFQKNIYYRLSNIIICRWI